MKKDKKNVDKVGEWKSEWKICPLLSNLLAGEHSKCNNGTIDTMSYGYCSYNMDCGFKVIVNPDDGGESYSDCAIKIIAKSLNRIANK